MPRRLPALAGAAFFYQSIALLGYTGLFLVITHLFVVLYEEPTLGEHSRAIMRRTVSGSVVVASIALGDPWRRA